MAMGRRKRDRQETLWFETGELARSPGHPFYKRLNQVLDEEDFDGFVEEHCSQFYADRMGRPSLAPAVYFRLLLIGYFEGIDSERGIAWRVADSLTLREFLDLDLSDAPPDHSTLSRTRRLIDLESHNQVFTWVLALLARTGLLAGKTLGVDSTTLEANAALRSIVRRDTGESYNDFLVRLAKASGIETPTREDLAKMDRKRKGKGSNKDWTNPHDPDATITKMKDGRTRLAHKAEHVVEMTSGAVVAVRVESAIAGDTQTIGDSVEEALENLQAVLDDPDAGEGLSDSLGAELVGDKGYHANAVLEHFQELGIRTYVSEPKRGRRRWKGKAAAQKATYANRRRMARAKGKNLQRLRGEKIERSFAHCYETGGMRRTHLRHHDNILKRALIHVAGFNLGLAMRKLCGVGKPKTLQGRLAALLEVFFQLVKSLRPKRWPSWNALGPPAKLYLPRCCELPCLSSLPDPGLQTAGLTFTSGC